VKNEDTTMIENLLVIGIGGTGAKCIESFVQLCAAGLGPKNVDIFLIDIDTENGNLTRTRNTIQDYRKVKSYLAETDETIFFIPTLNY
jgi:cell division GTPase FtsZ